MLAPQHKPGNSWGTVVLLSLLAVNTIVLEAQISVDNPFERIELFSPSLDAIWITSSAEKPIYAARDVFLTIQVTDITGAPIPRAHITLIRDETTTIKVTSDTDENGYVGLSVKPGSYRFFVSSPGFFIWDEQIDLGDTAPQKIEAELRPGSCPPGGPCVTVDHVQQWLNELPTSPPMDSVWVEEQ
jgi:hypothetical protein